MISCASSHPPELTVLWDQYSRRLLAFLRGKVSNEADAEDLLQEVFLRIHTNLAGLRSLCRLESWVYQIARNAVIDHYRSRRITEDLPETLAVDQAFYEEDLEAELAPSLRELVNTLPEPYREALLLTEYQGISQKDLATRLGISNSGAKSRVQRARAMIRDNLLSCCHFELDRRGRIVDYYERCCCCNPN